MEKWMPVPVLVLVLLAPGLLGGAQGLVAQCPRPGSNIPSYCSCSNANVTIRCDFQNQEVCVLYLSCFY
ncbi:hypothetical protein E2C01_042080 [Portunus trituberculatus]|uniref:Uncharacterized protein n=1 Tax=Portunus trituberculatus TaxID=210409 RepID=A0A5B7FP88_PORTR|nr:hypothetical protein [Portunus trituberculatus]